MKKVAVVSFLAIAALPTLASAEWTEIGKSGDGAVIYTDVAKIKERGKLTKAWFLIDYPSFQKSVDGPYRSATGQWEIDCDGPASRQLYRAIYSGPMGGGETVWSGTLVRGLDPIVPGTLGEQLLTAACPK